MDFENIPPAPLPDAPAPLQPDREFRRQRLVATLTLVALAIPVSLLIGGFVGTGLMRSISMASAASQAQDSREAVIGAVNQGRYNGPLGTIFGGSGGGIYFDADAFPKARFGGSGTGGDRTTAAEITTDESAQTPEVIEESGVIIDLLTGEPILGGAAPEAPTADPTDQTHDGSSDEPKPDSSRDLFDLGGDEETPAEDPEEDPKPAESNRSYRLFLGSFTSRVNADQLVSELGGKGVNARVTEKNQADDSVLFQVVTGGYKDKADAEAVAESLRSQGYSVWIS